MEYAENCVFRTYKTLTEKYLWFIVINWAFGIAVHLMLISNNLVNSMDSPWHFSSYYARGWEISIGRWMICILDQIRFGIVSSTLNSLVALFFFACGSALIVDCFELRSRFKACLTGMLFIATPLVCASLSFCYTSVAYGFAYFLSALSAYFAIKTDHVMTAILSGGIFLAFSLATYQAYLSVTCIVLLIYFIQMLYQNNSIHVVQKAIIKSVGTVLSGCILYKISITVFCAVLGVELFSYKNSGFSLSGIFLNLQQQLIIAYKEFFEFYFTGNIQQMPSCLQWIYILAFLMIGCVFIYKTIAIFKRNVMYGVLSVLAVCIIPMACNMILLLINAGNTILMTCGMALLFPLSLCLTENVVSYKLVKLSFTLCLVGLLWIDVCIVNNDQIAMLEGRTSVVAIANNIVTDLTDLGYFDSDLQEVAIVGMPAESRMFTATIAWESANEYAKFGLYWPIARDENVLNSWNGVLQEYCGVTLNFCPSSSYADLVETLEIDEMSCYPAEGSISVIDDILVVKVSECY